MSGEREDRLRAPSQADSDLFLRRLVRAAWLAVLLGLALEALLLVVALGLGRLPDWTHAVAETAQRVSWSTIVCVLIACGLAAQKARPAAMSALGFLAAPLALILARACHKAALGALGAAPSTSAASILVPATIKALEYGTFGAWLGWIGRRPGATLREHLRAGAVVGVVFGTLLVVVARPVPPAGEIVLRSTNELLFPVGCALVVYMTDLAARRSLRG